MESGYQSCAKDIFVSSHVTTSPHSLTIMSRFSKLVFTDLYINQQAVACNESINTCEIYQLGVSE